MGRMERHRLKTVMILILALMNGFLLFHLAGLRVSRYASVRTAEARLADLFAADGMTLAPGAVSHETPPGPFQPAWDETPEAAVSILFLGDGASLTDRGGTRVWTADGGSAQFQDGGSFSVTGLDIQDRAAALCRRFCGQYGYEKPDLPAVPDGEYAVPARYGGLDVCDCAVTFTFADGVLREVSGVLLPRTGNPVREEGTLYSASAALTAFQAVRRENRVAVSAVTGTRLCYTLRGDGTEAVLEPAWRIGTDTVDYYVNCVTGTVFSL